MMKLTQDRQINTLVRSARKQSNGQTEAFAATVVNSSITQIVKECQIKCIASWVYATLVDVV